MEALFTCVVGMIIGMTTCYIWSLLSMKIAGCLVGSKEDIDNVK